MRKNAPEKYLLAVILAAGLVLVFLTPLNAGFDEETHVARIWEMSSGELIPNRLLNAGPNYPTVFIELSYRQLRNPGAVSLDTMRDQLTWHIDWSNMLAYESRSVYFPSFYLIQASIMGIMGRVFDFPVAVILYTLRLSYLLIYALIAFLAVRWIPFGKWVIFILAIAPMSLVQASVVTPDAINNALNFLFIAWVLKISTSDSGSRMTRSEAWITIALVLAAATLKANNIPLLLLLLLIPKAKFGSGKNRWIAAGIVLAVVLVIFIGWNLLVTWQSFAAPSKGGVGLGSSLTGLLKNPFALLAAIFHSIRMEFGNYFRMWVGTSGYGYWMMPGIVYVLYPLGLILAVLTDSAHGRLSFRTRTLFIGAFVVTILATFAVFYLVSLDANNLIHGVQGRYFISATPLLLLALLPNKGFTALIGWIKGTALTVVILSVAAMGAAYHISCGSTLYSSSSCLQPKYKNWDPVNSIPIALSTTTRMEQSLTPVCRSLSSIQVWVNENSFNGTLTSCVTPAAGGSRSCAQVDSTLMPNSGWLTASFPVLAVNPGELYRLELSAVGSGVLTLMAFPVNEYPDHTLVINSTRQPGSLLFQYTCPGYLQTILDRK